MKVLVTGGAGYIGSVLVRYLLSANAEVTVVDNLKFNQLSLLGYCHNPRFNFVKGDVRDVSLMCRLISKADVIIHLAAIVGAPACDIDVWSFKEINENATKLIALQSGGDQLVIYPCTNSGYGTKSGDIYCTEDTPMEPITHYGKSKVMGERALFDFAPNPISLRLATVFGVSPRMRIDLLVNHFVYAAVTDGYIVLYEENFMRNYVHVCDVAECILYCIKNCDSMKGNIYNVGNDAINLSKMDLALRIQSFIPSFTVLTAEGKQDPDKRNYIVSNQRLRDAGFEATRSLDGGITELIKGYRMIGRHPLKNV